MGGIAYARLMVRETSSHIQCSITTNTMSEILDHRWNLLKRDRPDPLASNTPSLPTRFILRLYGYILLALSLIILFPYYTLYHYTFGPYLSWMPLTSLLLTRCIKFVGAHLRTHLPKVDPQEWVIPDVPYMSILGDRPVEMVRLPPIDEGYRQGFAVCERVEAVERPGFMITPPSARGQGQEEAKDGERVVLYLHGGYVWVDSRGVNAETHSQCLYRRTSLSIPFRLSGC
jgi:hypothetical protein